MPERLGGKDAVYCLSTGGADDAYGEFKERWDDARAKFGAALSRRKKMNRARGPEAVAALSNFYQATGDFAFKFVVGAVRRHGFDQQNAGSLRRFEKRGADEVCITSMHRLIKRRGASVHIAAARTAMIYSVLGNSFDAVVARLSRAYRRRFPRKGPGTSDTEPRISEEADVLKRLFATILDQNFNRPEKMQRRARGPEIITALTAWHQATGDLEFKLAIEAMRRYGFDQQDAGTLKRSNGGAGADSSDADILKRLLAMMIDFRVTETVDRRRQQRDMDAQAWESVLEQFGPLLTSGSAGET